MQEETGLVVTAWTGPLYRVTTDAPAMGWQMRVEVYRGLSVEGELTIGNDPDGIVVAASYVPPEQCHLHLAGGHPWVGEPLGDWLAARWLDDDAVPHYRYEVTGSGLHDVVVARRHG